MYYPGQNTQVNSHRRSWARIWRTFCGCLGTALVLLNPGSTRAFEDTLAVGVDAGYAAFVDAPGRHGFGAGLDLDVGLSDMFSFRARAAYGAFLNETPAARQGHFLGLQLEVIYLIDILDIVPYVGAGLTGAYRFESKKMTADNSFFNGGVHAALGIEYLFTRAWSLAVDVRVGWLPIVSYGDESQVHLSAGLRLSRLFEL